MGLCLANILEKRQQRVFAKLGQLDTGDCCRVRHPMFSFLRLSSSECRRPSFSVALQAGQPDIAVDMAHGVTEPIDAELLGALWPVGPQELNLTRGTVVVLRLFQRQDVINLQAESAPSGQVLVPIGCQLSLNDFALLFGEHGRVLRTLFWRTDHSLELVHIFYPRNGQIGEICPLEVVIHDPNFLGI